MWDRVTEDNQLEGLHTEAFFYEQLNDIYACVSAIADQLNISVPAEFYTIKRKSPSGTYNSMGWNGGVLTLLKLLA
jgi:hypothetical protein